jgi:hypothetical protein
LKIHKNSWKFQVLSSKISLAQTNKKKIYWLTYEFSGLWTPSYFFMTHYGLHECIKTSFCCIETKRYVGVFHIFLNKKNTVNVKDCFGIESFSEQWKKIGRGFIKILKTWQFGLSLNIIRHLFFDLAKKMHITLLRIQFD